MAQPGEIPFKPMDPSVLSVPGSEPGQSITGKRRREDGFPAEAKAGEEAHESAPKRQAQAQDVLFRIVVPSRQIGKVIGKEGCRIQKIREETKATIKIADAVAVSPSRNHLLGFSFPLFGSRESKRKSIFIFFLLK